MLKKLHEWIELELRRANLFGYYDWKPNFAPLKKFYLNI